MGRHYRECHQYEKEQVDRIEFKRETIVNTRRYLSPGDLRSPCARPMGQKRAASWDADVENKKRKEKSGSVVQKQREKRKGSVGSGKEKQKEQQKEKASDSKEKQREQEREKETSGNKEQEPQKERDRTREKKQKDEGKEKGESVEETVGEVSSEKKEDENEEARVVIKRRESSDLAVVTDSCKDANISFDMSAKSSLSEIKKIKNDYELEMAVAVTMHGSDPDEITLDTMTPEQCDSLLPVAMSKMSQVGQKLTKEEAYKRFLDAKRLREKWSREEEINRSIYLSADTQMYKEKHERIVGVLQEERKKRREAEIKAEKSGKDLQGEKEKVKELEAKVQELHEQLLVVAAKCDKAEGMLETKEEEIKVLKSKTEEAASPRARKMHDLFKSMMDMYK